MSEDIYEWKTMRKVWHLGGCLIMIAIFYLCLDLPKVPLLPVNGLDFLVIFAWAETAMCFAIDLIRFYHPKQNEAVKRLPFFGQAMRPHEESKFNASTYYLFASALLITGLKYSLWQDHTLVMAIAVLGLADPASAWVRHQIFKRHWPGPRAWGLLAFLVSSTIVIWLVKLWYGTNFGFGYIFSIGAIVALIESYTKDWVAFVRPLTVRVQSVIRFRATEWLCRLYPDDNFVIPLATATLAILFSGW